MLWVYFEFHPKVKEKILILNTTRDKHWEEKYYDYEKWNVNVVSHNC